MNELRSLLRCQLTKEERDRLICKLCNNSGYMEDGSDIKIKCPCGCHHPSNQGLKTDIKPSEVEHDQKQETNSKGI